MTRPGYATTIKQEVEFLAQLSSSKSALAFIKLYWLKFSFVDGLCIQRLASYPIENVESSQRFSSYCQNLYPIGTKACSIPMMNDIGNVPASWIPFFGNFRARPARSASRWLWYKSYRTLLLATSLGPSCLSVLRGSHPGHRALPPPFRFALRQPCQRNPYPDRCLRKEDLQLKKEIGNQDLP